VCAIVVGPSIWGQICFVLVLGFLSFVWGLIVVRARACFHSFSSVGVGCELGFLLFG